MACVTFAVEEPYISHPLVFRAALNARSEYSASILILPMIEKAEENLRRALRAKNEAQIRRTINELEAIEEAKSDYVLDKLLEALEGKTTAADEDRERAVT